MQIDRALVEMARSAGWSDRAGAGQALVEHVGDPEADGLLRELLLDEADTAVIAQTAASLLERRDFPAWRVFVGAWNLADPTQADHLMGALSGALFSASLLPGSASGIRDLMTVLIADSDENVRVGARQLQPYVVAALPG